MRVTNPKTHSTQRNGEKNVSKKEINKSTNQYNL